MESIGKVVVNYRTGLMIPFSGLTVLLSGVDTAYISPFMAFSRAYSMIQLDASYLILYPQLGQVLWELVEDKTPSADGCSCGFSSSGVNGIPQFGHLF